MFRALYAQVCREQGISGSGASDVLMSPAATSPAMHSSRSGDRGASDGSAAQQQQLMQMHQQQLQQQQSEAATNAQLLKDMQATFERYREDNTRNVQLLTEELDRARNEANQMRVQTIRLTTQLDNITERYHETRKVLAAQEQEYERLRTKNSEFSASIVSHQRQLEAMEHDLRQTRGEATTLRAANSHLTAERDLLSSSEQQLRKEIDSLNAERRTQNGLLQSLQMLQNEVARTDREHRLRFEAEVESLKVL